VQASPVTWLTSQRFVDSLHSSVSEHPPQLTIWQPLLMKPHSAPSAAQLVVGLHAQSLSVCAMHPGGQQPSSFVQLEMLGYEH